MKFVNLGFALCMAAAVSFNAYADGCEYDTQCKGDRICENKICVSPSANHASTPAAKPSEHSSGLLGIFNKSEAPAAKSTYFCCTNTEKQGPFNNPDADGKTYQVGDACSGTSKIARHYVGRVCN